MHFTIANAITISTKIKAQLATLEGKYPDDTDLQLLHELLNTAAIAIEDKFDQARGVLGGSGGTFHPDTGGTNKNQ